MTQKKLMACLTFDFDAWSGLAARGMLTPTPVSRGEFGVVAVPRILELLKRYGITASFYTPGIVIETYPRSVEAIVAAGHEMGNHGYTHVPPSNLSREQEEESLVKGGEAVEKFWGRRPAGYRSPSWDLSDNTVDLLLKHGYLYDSSMMAHDHSPYRVRQGDKVYVDRPMEFGTVTNLYEMPVAWSLDDFPHFEFMRTPTSVTNALMNTNGVLSNWLDDFEYMRRTCDWGVLTYTCHPYVIGRGHRMLFLERLIEGLMSKGAEFVTMEAAIHAFQAREKAGLA